MGWAERAAEKQQEEYEYYHSMESEFNELHEQLQFEKKMREENPGLKELWDQYQLMLKLLDTRSPKEEPKEVDDEWYGVGVDYE